MAAYQGVKGYKVQSTASDPSNPIIGQVWYNTTSDTLKYRTTLPGSNVFSAGGNMSNFRAAGGGSPAGTINSALATAGYKGPGSPGQQAETEEYDGTTWTAGGNVTRGDNNRTGFASFGSQTANVIAGGAASYTAGAEEYDGTSWTAVTNIPGAGRGYFPGSGTEAAGLITMGYNAPDQTDTQPFSTEYDGSTWTAGGNCNTGSYNHSQFGAQTAAAISGGYNPSTAYIARAEEYDGSTWTTVTALPAARNSHASSGTQTSGLVMGGYVASAGTATSLEYDGTNWSAGSSMATARDYPRSSGASNTSAVVFGGFTDAPAPLNSTEEYGVGAPTAATKTVTGA